MKISAFFQAERLACGLIHLGVEKGDRVGIWGPNTYEWVTAQFATALGGMVLVSRQNPQWRKRPL